MQQLAPLSRRQSRIFFLCCGLVLVLCLGVIDYLTGAELSFAPLYLLPIFLAVWYVGRTAGILTSVASSVAGLLADLFGSARYSHPLVHYWNAAMSLVSFMVIALLLSAWREALNKQAESTRQDALTGATSPGCFFELAYGEISRAQRYRRPFTFVYVDIDDFQAVNARLGHHACDMILRQVARTIRESVRESDVVARLGDDEFAILLPEARYEPSQRTILRMRENLLRALGGAGITVSIGAVTFMVPPVSVQEMVQHGNDLMRSAKHDGKDTVRHEVWG